MLKRTIAGLIMAAILFLIVWLTGFSHFVFDAVLLAVCALATYEMYGATTRADTKIESQKGYKISKISLAFAILAIYPLCYFLGYTGLTFTAILSILIAFLVFIFDDKKTFNDFAVNKVVIFYPQIILGI